MGDPASRDRSSSSERITAAQQANMREYSSVNRNDDVDDDGDDEEEALAGVAEEPANRNNGSLRRRGYPIVSSRGQVFYLWIIIAGLVTAIVVGLAKYGNVIFSSPTGGSAAPKSSNGSSSSTSISPTTTTSGSTGKESEFSVTYDPSVSTMKWNPFDLNPSDDSTALLSPATPNYDDDDDESSSYDEDDETDKLGFIMQPDIVNGTAVFVSEGDLYWARLLDNEQGGVVVPHPAALKLTVSVGNVRTPKINPVYPHLIAYTATYQSRRDVYVMDLRRRRQRRAVAARRLTYFDSAYGVSSVAGWKADGTTLVFGSYSNAAVGVKDLRLYEIALAINTSTSSTSTNNNNNNKKKKKRKKKSNDDDEDDEDSLQVLETRPVPLAQATEGVWSQQHEDCLYFVRYKQGSHTARYVGGTAEGIWAYCPGQQKRAVHLTRDYIGTSKNPTIHTVNGKEYLFFLSDRSPIDNKSQPKNTSSKKNPTVFDSGEWRATSMNLWVAPLPTAAEMYKGATKKFVLKGAVQLTRVSCHFDGMALQEYALDHVSGDILLRIGADLHHLPASKWRKQLRPSGAPMEIPPKLPIQILSDLHELQERQIRINLLTHLKQADVFETDFDTTAVLLTVRGQVWVAPVIDNTEHVLAYQGAGQNIPARRYRVIPGAMTGGSIRVLTALKVPLMYAKAADGKSSRRLALVLATDPLSATAEHAFYLVEIQADHMNSFANLDQLQDPFVGGHINGGSVKDGGLGSIEPTSVSVSPCGRRFAWADTDNRICVMSMPIYVNNSTDDGSYGFQCLPKKNDMDEPLAGTLSVLTWSPGGRYLAVQHNALNQFAIISIVDCGDPLDDRGEVADINIGQIAQVTPSRFNSYDVYWGKSTFDIFLYQTLSALSTTLGLPNPDDLSTTLYFISDRDIISDVTSPWGSRAPSPHFPRLEANVYALPLTAKLDDGGDDVVDSLLGRFAGGGALEVYAGDLDAYEESLKMSAAKSDENDARRQLKEHFRRKLALALNGRRLTSQEKHSVARYLESTDSPTSAPSLNTTANSPFPKDLELDLPTRDLSFARKTYRVAHIPRGKYVTILSQTVDDGSLVLIDVDDTFAKSLKLFTASPFPSDGVDVKVVSGISSCGLSTTRKFLYCVSPAGKTTVLSNTATGISGFVLDSLLTKNQADTSDMSISVWPALEYRQMYNDAWRMLRDYFYDPKLHGVDWKAVYKRYDSLVQRCGKREELDDVLGQMASETSALHSFVYGGEYNIPEVPPMEPATLGAALKRVPEWKGFMVTEIPQRDPDFNLVNGKAQYCPISDQALRPTGQRGLAVGDVIVAVNGESVMHGPGIDFLLRGSAGRSVRLEVLRLSSRERNETVTVHPEAVVAVPITTFDAESLRYGAWEWKTRELAKELASKAGFSVGYIHMRAMDRDGEDAFARGYFPDHDKDALIIDVRHNNGGNIDSWILSVLQKTAWMYWAGRGDERYGELDWDQQFAFRGKVVVLIDEHTSSNGEGVARGISELGLGRLVGTRTWGGGIWGSSANHLVDGGISAAPQWGIFNEKLSWGGGVEMTGVSPDIEVDNDPRLTFDGRDEQMERAISVLKAWISKEPIVNYHIPGSRPDMSLHNDDCPA